MIYVLRVIGSIIAGFALALVLVIALELFSSVVHPLPADFAGTADEMCRHVERYPAWVLVIAAVAWTSTAFVSTWLATRLGGKIPGILLSLFLVWAVVFNVAMLPYPVWFEAVSVLGIVAACLAGIGFPGRRVTLQPS